MKKLLIILSLLFPAAALAQNGAVQNHCYLGGVHSFTAGLPSTNFMNGIIPSCTVTVYLTGTQTKATIFSNAGGTPLSNPFTANNALSLDPGGWIFYAATGQGYDVVMSGGIAPLTYQNPVTITDVFAGGGSSGPVSGCPTTGCVYTGGISGPSSNFENVGTYFFADAFPSSCTVADTPYTTQLDCAWYTALQQTATATSNPTVVLGSQNYTTCAGLPMILPGAMGPTSVNLVSIGLTGSLNPGNFSQTDRATITQTCSISTGTLSLPSVAGSAAKQVTVDGVSIDANHLAPFAMQILGYNENSVFRHGQAMNGTTGPMLFGVFHSFPDGQTVGADLEDWLVVDNCGVANGCGGGGAVSVSLSGGVPSFTITNPGSNYDSNTLATLVGYQNGTRNVPCTTMGTTTPVISGGQLIGITSTASGCSGAVYVQLTDERAPQYGIDFENFTDAMKISGLDVRTGAVAGIYTNGAGSDVFVATHAWGQGLFGIKQGSFATFVGTNCGETSLACFDNASSFARTTAIGTMYNSGTQYQGFSLFRNETSTSTFKIFGVQCQSTQTAEYHTLANLFGPIDTNADANSTKLLGNALKDVEYCGSGTGETLNAIPGNTSIVGSILAPSNNSITTQLFFSLNSSPFVDCIATGFTQPPTISGSVVTFPSNGTDNSGSIYCTDHGGRVTIQAVPDSGTPTLPQTFDMTTQFATSSALWLRLDPLFGSGEAIINAPSGVAAQNGNFVLSGSGIRTNIASLCPSGTCTAQLPNLSTTTYTLAASLSGTTGSIGGSALTAGQIASGTASISGAAVTMGCIAQPTDGTNMAASGFQVGCAITSSGTATVSVMAVVAGTPAAKTYAVRVIE